MSLLVINHNLKVFLKHQNFTIISHISNFTNCKYGLMKMWILKLASNYSFQTLFVSEM